MGAAGAEIGLAADAGAGVAVRASGAQPVSLGATDLAEILSRFNEASAALQTTHETLRGEVERLTRELEEANEQLQRSRRLAALGEMAAGIAHEVRNPLASIALDARMLAVEAGERGEARAAAERIGAAVRGLNGVVGDVLCFAREMKPRVEAVDVEELVERARGECAAMAAAAGVELECEGGGGAAAMCDGELAHRALTNLVRNAVEAVSESGRAGARRVTLGGGVRVVGGRRGVRECVVWVRDTGPGVSADVVERMFNPFFTTRAAGTGLGLAIVHRIMDAHGGRVEVRNNAGADGRAADGVAIGGRGDGHGCPGLGCGATFGLVFPERMARGRRPGASRGMEKDR